MLTTYAFNVGNIFAHAIQRARPNSGILCISQQSNGKWNKFPVCDDTEKEAEAAPTLDTSTHQLHISTHTHCTPDQDTIHTIPYYYQPTNET